METCDVLIVGGGPAGSSCAWKLRQSGVDVVLLDKCRFPRNKVCAGWITPQVVDELELPMDNYRQHGILQPITGFLTGMIGRREIETSYNRVVSYGIRRFEFDDFLLRRANVRLRLGEDFRSIRRENGDWIVNEDVRSRIVVGAGGHFCPVARWFCPDERTTHDSEAERATTPPTVVAQEIEFEMTERQQQECSVHADRPELYFCHDLKGYGWIFRKGNYLNIGLGRENEPRLTKHVSEFLQTLIDGNKIPADAPEHFQGHAYRLRTVPPRSTSQTNVVLIGDAAGLADRHSGEGIYPAIKSGLLAARCIIDAECGCRDDLGKSYAEHLHRKFHVQDQTTPIEWIPDAIIQFIAQRLLRSPLFTRRVLLDRWFLHAAEPNRESDSFDAQSKCVPSA